MNVVETWEDLARRMERYLESAGADTEPTQELLDAHEWAEAILDALGALSAVAAPLPADQRASLNALLQSTNDTELIFRFGRSPALVA